jgi:hypothetical protein
MQKFPARSVVAAGAALSTLGLAGTAEAQEPITGLCTDPITLELSSAGNGGKTLDLPGDRFITTSPGLVVTLTNETTPRQSVTRSITGTVEQTTDAEGNIVFVSRGRSLNWDPVAGLVFVTGRWTWIFDEDGNLVQPLSGSGQSTDACALIGSTQATP